jgi:predicted kinase
MGKTLLILSGVSGSGKTTLAETLKAFGSEWDDQASSLDDSDCYIATADDTFYENGEYKFDASKLGYAHAQCKIRCENAMGQGVSLVIVNNTTTDRKSAKPYLDLAEKYRYAVFWTVVIPHHDNEDVHDVPFHTKLSQAAKLEETIRKEHVRFLGQKPL